MKIKAVIFDLDNTLIDFEKFKDVCTDAAIEGMIKAGLEMSKAEAKKRIIEIVYNASAPEYYEEALHEKNSCIASNGALVAYSGKKTGRSPTDKRIVKSDTVKDVWWDKVSPNIEMK